MHSKAGGWRSRLFFERRYLKRNPTQSLRWSYFQGFTPQNSWQNTHVARKKQHIKPLKIRPHATKPIDIVLRRTAGTGDPALCTPVMMLFSRWYLFHPQQAVWFHGFKIHRPYHNRTFCVLSAGVKPLKSDRVMLGCTLSLKYHLSKSTITSVPATNMIISFLAEGPGWSSKDDISKKDSFQAR